MTSSRIKFNKGSYRISISKKVIAEAGLTPKKDSDPIDVEVSTSKKHGAIILRGTRIKKFADPSIKSLPIDREILAEYIDDFEFASEKEKKAFLKRMDYKNAFVTVSHLPDDLAKNRNLQNLKTAADFHSRRILEAHREFKRKTKNDQKELEELHEKFSSYVDFLMKKKSKRPQLGDTSKPSQYDKL